MGREHTSPSPLEEHALRASVSHLARIGLLVSGSQQVQTWKPHELVDALAQVHIACARLGQLHVNGSPLDAVNSFVATLIGQDSKRRLQARRNIALLQSEVDHLKASLQALSQSELQVALELDSEADWLMLPVRELDHQALASSSRPPQSADALVHGPSQVNGHTAADALAARPALKRLISVVAAARTLSSAISSVRKARAEFLNELNSILQSANAFAQDRVSSNAMAARAADAGITAPPHVQALTLALRRLQQGCTIHAAREAALRQSFAQVHDLAEQQASFFQSAPADAGASASPQATSTRAAH